MTVINPWIFYIIDMVCNLSAFIMIILAVACFGLLAFGFIILNMMTDRDLFEDELKKAKKKFKRLIKIFVLVLAFCVFIPSKETMYKMLIAESVTYENLDKVAEVIQDSVDYIFNKLEGE